MRDLVTKSENEIVDPQAQVLVVLVAAVGLLVLKSLFNLLVEGPWHHLVCSRAATCNLLQVAGLSPSCYNCI